MPPAAKDRAAPGEEHKIALSINISLHSNNVLKLDHVEQLSWKCITKKIYQQLFYF